MQLFVSETMHNAISSTHNAASELLPTRTAAGGIMKSVLLLLVVCVVAHGMEVTIEDTAAVAKAGAFGPCKTCVFVIERIKKGTNMLLPSICAELYEKFSGPDTYSSCHQTLNALSTNGNNVRYWLFEGCYKYEIYQAKEWVKPCPSHVMCSVLKDLSGKPFCTPLPMEDPFKKGKNNRK